MKIKKTSETTPRTSQTVNQYSTSTSDSYSCNYLNTVLGDIETILTELTTGGGVSNVNS